MAENREGQECERCRDKFRKSEEVYLAKAKPFNPAKHRQDPMLLCADCAHTHVKEYVFLSYLIYVGGIE